MRINYIFLPVLILLPFLSYSQSGYLTGTSQEGIEPDQSLISLHLGGYGAPRDGRFTLQWIKKGSVPAVAAAGGLNDKLYIISNGDLFSMNPSENNSNWGKAGKAENIRSIAGFNNELYAVNYNGELLKTKLQGGIKWKKIGSADATVTSIAVLNNTLFAADGNGSMWLADLAKSTIEWIKSESVNHIVSLAANSRKLFALTAEGVLYQSEPGRKDSKWLKAAYINGQTIKEEIKHITVLNSRLYGISKENVLYLGEHRTEGNLTARAMAIKSGQKTVVILNVDVCGLNDTFVGLLKQEVYRKHHIPASAIFINSSHTHFAPVSQNWLTWQEPNQRPDSLFLYSTVKNRILNAIDNALLAMVPAELSFGRGAADIGYNRSLADHPELYDKAVDVIKVEYTGTNRESYLFLAACHPVHSTAGTLNYTISANFPGVARKLVEERTGTSNSLFLQGTAGDINPIDNGEYITGEKLANEVIAVLNRPMTKLSGPISCFLDTINFPVIPWTKEEIMAYRAENIDKTGDVSAEKNVKWCDLMLKYISEGTMPKSMPVYINTINIGNWKLMGFSGETTTTYGLETKKFWPDKLISVAGYTNDVSSYLPTHMHIEKGNYEGKESFFWYGVPNIFPQNVDETILNRIKSLER
ncbi:MAG: hypothetical protein NTV01_19790 [Bacteroidia bacterium]|nr:hypothetical protein [Bacteroidia bacterium]